MSSVIKVLSKEGRTKTSPSHDENEVDDIGDSSNIDISIFKNLKYGSEAKSFKLIDEKEWNIVVSEPESESSFFTDGHSAMSIISVLGSQGVGKSTLLNKIAGKEAFNTYNSIRNEHPGAIDVKHITKGIDIYSTNHRILLDCQPLLASSVLEDFLSGLSSSQLPKNIQITDPVTSAHMISLQLTTFLIATSDFVILMSRWLIDLQILKLISSAIMIIGEANIRSKFVVFSEDKKVIDSRFKNVISSILGVGRIEAFFDNERELIDFITPYPYEKCKIYLQDPSTFTGKNWLASCQRIWNSTIKNSSMFSDYALQLANINYMTT